MKIEVHSNMVCPHCRRPAFSPLAQLRNGDTVYCVGCGQLMGTLHVSVDLTPVPNAAR